MFNDLSTLLIFPLALSYPLFDYQKYCIYSNKKHRCNGELALHVLDMIDSTIRSAKISKPIELSTNCEQPKYFSEEEISKLIK